MEMAAQLKPGDRAYQETIGRRSCRLRHYEVMYINHDETATVKRRDTVKPTIEIVPLATLTPAGTPSITTAIVEAAAAAVHDPSEEPAPKIVNPNHIKGKATRQNFSPYADPLVLPGDDEGVFHFAY
jgi:hypothetical protein